MVERQEEGLEEGRATVAAAHAAVRAGCATDRQSVMVERKEAVHSHQQAGMIAGAENAARVEAGQDAHVLEMLGATCSAKGKWRVKAAHAAHKQQGGGMSLGTELLPCGGTLEGQAIALRAMNRNESTNPCEGLLHTPSVPAAA